jgi:hypothetical protein
MMAPKLCFSAADLAIGSTVKLVSEVILPGDMLVGEGACIGLACCWMRTMLALSTGPIYIKMLLVHCNATP